MLELTAATSGVLQDDYANHVQKGRRDFRLSFLGRRPGLLKVANKPHSTHPVIIV